VVAAGAVFAVVVAVSSLKLQAVIRTVSHAPHRHEDLTAKMLSFGCKEERVVGVSAAAPPRTPGSRRAPSWPSPRCRRRPPAAAPFLPDACAAFSRSAAGPDTRSLSLATHLQLCRRVCRDLALTRMC
jgi:hypothetical protein